MVIRPWGYGIWENMQRQLDAMFKATGHVNAYFPLFIPLSYFAEGSRRTWKASRKNARSSRTAGSISDADGKMRPAPAPTERAARRQADIGDDHRRDLCEVGAELSRPADPDQPMGKRRPLGNAAAHFSPHDRVPLAGRPHRARERSGSARGNEAHARRLRDVRARLSSPSRSSRGEKSESERFPGAVQTLCIEAMVQDRKAIQAGTSHFLGQNFSRASGIQFQTRDGKQEFGWTTSWGMSTRMIGTLIMAHCRRRRPRPAAAHRADSCRHHPDHAEGRDARRRPGGGR